MNNICRDWSNEATPKEVSNGDILLIMNSGLGDDSHGSCQRSGSPFDAGEYIPAGSRCLIRDVDYEKDLDVSGNCWFATPDDIIELIGTETSHIEFSHALETRDGYHGSPHICIGGVRGNMAQIDYSPDDPIFYLHHTFVDYIWSLWQDCNDYEGKTTNNAFAGSLTRELEYIPYTEDTYTAADVIDLEDIDVIYEQGPFFENTIVDESEDCPGTVNSNWFTDFGAIGAFRRRLSGYYTTHRGHAPRNKGTGRKKRIRYKPSRKSQRASSQGVYGGMEEEEEEEEELEIEVEECTNGRNACPIPDYFEDCSTMSDDEINALTLQDIISMDGINDCQIAMRQENYEYAKGMGYLRSLCNGCMDPHCDQSMYSNKCSVGNQRETNY